MLCVQMREDALVIHGSPVFRFGTHAGLAVAIEELTDEVVLVKLDDNVAAVWRTVLSGDVDWLTERISSFEMSHERDVT